MGSNLLFRIQWFLCIYVMLCLLGISFSNAEPAQVDTDNQSTSTPASPSTPSDEQIEKSDSDAAKPMIDQGMTVGEMMNRFGGSIILPDRMTQVVDSAVDFDRTVDTPALYALLADARDWPADEEFAVYQPDYFKIIKEPANYRMKMFRLEGEFVAIDEDMRLARQAAFPDVQPWIIHPLDKPGSRDTVVIFVVNPPPKPPEQYTRVGINARFLEVWEAPNQDGQSVPYLVFVGQQVKTLSNSSGSTAPANNFSQLQVIGMVVVIFGAVIYFIWRLRKQSGQWFRTEPERLTKVAELARARRQAESEKASVDDAEDADASRDLPDEPDAALDELSKRKED